ncbi:hypothetical protein V7O66_04345 [Methanolobus sp. ZRKC3]|uniref:hypothetical protein n=1 Tax=Methanolobus sp. ZRKC3 TaxID=3125786 RepID=UPI003254E81D
MYDEWEQAKKEVVFTSGIDVNELGEVKNNPNIMEARGIVPIIETEIEREALSERLGQTVQNSKGEIIEKYAHPKGPLIAYGYGGYVSISILVGSEVDDKTLDSIYDIIEQEANKVGIENVPVVFEYEEFPHEDEEVDVEIDAEERENNNTTPGFSALTLLLVFSIIMWFRRDQVF